MKSAVHLDAHTVADIEFQPASLDIWDAKYRLAAKDGAKGGALFFFSLDDGKKIKEVPLEDTPVYDGAAVADGKLFVSTEEGHLYCFGK